jgi:hypothetical protein
VPRSDDEASEDDVAEEDYEGEAIQGYLFVHILLLEQNGCWHTQEHPVHDRLYSERHQGRHTSQPDVLCELLSREQPHWNVGEWTKYNLIECVVDE